MRAGLLKRHAEDVREVALLTPYRAQLSVLRRAALRELDERALLNVTFATIDGFQVQPPPPPPPPPGGQNTHTAKGTAI